MKRRPNVCVSHKPSGILKKSALQAMTKSRAFSALISSESVLRTRVFFKFGESRSQSSYPGLSCPASLSEVETKIDYLRNEIYRVLSDEELKNFEDSLDRMNQDADNLEVSLNTLLEFSNVSTSELPVKNDLANYNVKLPFINLPEFSG
ncbi:hypothetical protein TNCV_2125521 [Trichonephila clavipes]|nr:hypothetical protein TNCV_2125521 [Trichonephila clavipes]